MYKRIVRLAALALGAALAGPVLAHGGGHTSFGLAIGVPIGAPYYPYYYPPAYYPSPYYYAPAYAPSSPPVYVERQDAAPQEAPATAYWYYCAESKTYYPYVKHCPAGWQRVAPQPQE
jgi:hypothetical protein